MADPASADSAYLLGKRILAPARDEPPPLRRKSVVSSSHSASHLPGTPS
jgi:hypothetical protein